MPLQLVGTAQNADRSLYANATVWTGTINGIGKYSFRVLLGDGIKNLSGAGGLYLVALIVNGRTYRGGPEEYEMGTAVQAEIQSEDFIFPAGATVSLNIYSPNASETDVDCTATLYKESSPSLAEVQALKTIVLPATATQTLRQVGSTLYVFVGEHGRIAPNLNDATGEDVDLDGRTLELTIESLDKSLKYTVYDEDIERPTGGFSFIVPSEVTERPREWKWALWDIEAEMIIAFGAMPVTYQPQRTV